jgi:dinuclear metal center YbgI/SA1388 family protein
VQSATSASPARSGIVARVPPEPTPATVPTPVAEIVSELDTLLQPGRFQDYCPNGLQVPGPTQASTLATGVSAGAELFELAAAERADLLLVHHGLFWGSAPGPIDAQLKRRLELLFDAEIALAAYHLPLDAHPRLGNNALIARALGAEPLGDPFALHRGEPIGCLARLSGDGDSDGHGDGLPAAELFARVRSVTGREPLVFDAGPSHVRTLAIVSGSGADYLGDAAIAGADALLTGEPAERVMAQARELGLHFIAAGHYATETFGVRALGAHLAERFGVRHVFLDVPNPV